MNPYAALGLLVAANIPVFYLLFRWFWNDWEDFTEEFNTDPCHDIDEFSPREYLQNVWGYLFLCVGILIAEYLFYVIYLGGAPTPELEAAINMVLEIFERLE
jgi:hypothetical protein